ncbi:BREX-2 system adenine-specific DNA-methyltransferase PglX [Pyxidicoccus xibeiensis]|uniref:BREX-2 system adenine-specific DNA-methyltransferase PglX n=1 Tax=Pyxidicoccus xibeiensis TaxID=2906759 RepID=UPI0020A7AC2A|nr:BREX-2 system adenine-specific DNA-methyltransferase PglX [Pyxidicoccus xibeiensis]MCP3141009.1 BREX-2 system adenine-specific DNA-methyltransferase PglX [Pyxidicoccus xibeiensis]
MKANDRARLTTALRDHVAKIAADLRAKMRAPGAARAAAEQLHKDERVAEDFEVWTDLLSRRAAVLWVLKSVYVRVLEDRGLLAPGRLLDPEAQQLFEKLAPNLGDTAFLRWIYKDLASTRGGVPELFSPQPAEVSLPSDDLSRALIGFWRHRDADSGAVWSFAEERFEGELMGDLYQELDPVVKDRFALCQTPDFVRAFILNRTLTPAIETFGADEVRLLDPACGSGHFLIDGLKRLVAATADKHSDWSKEQVVAHALDRVVGIDLNDYACALARTRLIMTAAELAGVTKLADAARFHPHVYWADGLEQVEREEQKPSLQFSLFEPVEEKPRATLTRSDVRAALKKVFEIKFHAVVANPPYNEERDRLQKEYHRENVGRRRRYVAAFKDYGLGALFTERCFQLAKPLAFVGVITANNFMKGEAGKPFVEEVLAGIDLSLVVDLSGAIVAHSGFETPTVMLFGRNRRPEKLAPIRTVIGKSGDTDRPVDLSTAAVWSSVVAGWATLGFENDYIRVDDLARARMAAHPWVLHVGDTSDLISKIEATTRVRLGDVVEQIGFASFAGLDEPFYQPKGTFVRLGYSCEFVRPLLAGTNVRDWCLRPTEEALTPYGVQDAEPLPFEGRLARPNHLWRYRTALNSVSSFSGDRASEGANWWNWYRWIPARYRVPLRITFADVATHNHFALERGGFVFNNTAPIIRVKGGGGELAHLELLGFLNSSLASFWLRNNAKKVGGRSSGTKKQAEPWAQRLRFSGGLVERLPYLADDSGRVREVASRIEKLARELVQLEPSYLLGQSWSDLSSEVVTAERKHRVVRERMIALQEELDWTVYCLFGLAPRTELTPLSEIDSISSEHRPFAIHLARRVAAGDVQTHWFSANGGMAVVDVPDVYQKAYREVLERRLKLIATHAPLGALEAPEYKRKWEPYNYSDHLEVAAFAWLSDQLEAVFANKARPLTTAHLAAAVQDDERFLDVASLYEGRRDVDVQALVSSVLATEAVPTHPSHIYTVSGLLKRNAWEEVWAFQRREDAGEKLQRGESLPEFSQGSRGKSVDFLRTEYWRLRGKLNVPRERFISFTEVPGRSGVETLYGWAGWTAQQRVKAILTIDEELEDASVPLADRIGLLDSSWRLLPDVAREDVAAATRLKAELQALVGPEGPSRELIEDWKKRFPPPTSRASGAKRGAKKAAARDEEDCEIEESDES